MFLHTRLATAFIRTKESCKTTAKWLWSFCFTSLLLNCIFQIEEKERKYIHRAEEFIWFWINYSCIIKSCLLKLICWNRGPLVKMATFFSFYVLESCVFCCCDWTVVCSSQKMTVFQRAISAFINQTGRQYIKKKKQERLIVTTAVVNS